MQTEIKVKMVDSPSFVVPTVVRRTDVSDDQQRLAVSVSTSVYEYCEASPTSYVIPTVNR
jgi:hypothetical protein